MIVVTGGAGFIGSNVVKHLNAKGLTDIVVVDQLVDGKKMRNLADLEFSDYLESDRFLSLIVSNSEYLDRVKAIVHMGACSATTEWDGRYVMENNYEYSKKLLHWCLIRDVKLIYASSASVYGISQSFRESRENERPINMYAFSKFQFDQYVRYLNLGPEKQPLGLRFFNVYGPREFHKGSMASVVFHFYNQIKTDGMIKLFKGIDGIQDGEQRRDFVYVGDVAEVIDWGLNEGAARGVFNVGTGTSSSYNKVARAVLDYMGQGEVHYIDFPDELRGSYQNFTEADLTRLRAAGYGGNFLSVSEGVTSYLDWLENAVNSSH